MRYLNRINVKRPAGALLFILTLLTLAAPLYGQFYAVSALGTLGGTNRVAYAINNHEQIVGSAQTAMGNYHAFMFDGGRMTDLGTMGGSNSWAYGINDMGWMVGATEMPLTNMHAFLCTNALNPMIMDLGTLGGSNSAAFMVNMHGDIVGWSAMANGSHHGFFMTNALMGSMMDLGTAGGTNSELYCASSNRMVVGFATMSNGTMQPIMSTNAMRGSLGMMTMGMGGMGASGGQAWSINNMGDTAGMAQMPGGNHHAVASVTGGMMGGRMNVDLGTLGGTNSIAYCLTDAGTVVGTAQTTNGIMHAFMATNVMGGSARMMDLNDMIPGNSGWELMEARGMNTAGQIIGWGMNGGHTNAFLLTPVAGPTMMTFVPGPAIVGPGAPVRLQMQMNASEPLSYQWLHDGVPVPGATNSTLSFPEMNMANVGQYTMMARNSIGTVASSSTVIGMFSMGMTNGTPLLTVAAPAGAHFRIDYSDNLGSSPNWQTMTNFNVVGSLSQISVTPQPGSHSQFYRAVMVP